MTNSLRFALISLGCAKNLTDTESVYTLLLQKGFIVTNNVDEADLLLINTCGFIGPAVKETEETIREYVEWKREAVTNDLSLVTGNKLYPRRIVVFGCAVERFKEKLQKLFPEVDLWDGVGKQQDLVKAIVDLFVMRPVPSPQSLATSAKLTLTAKYTAYVKIAEGCSKGCTYCTIPAIRGPYRSRPVEEIVAEVKGLVARGVKEIILVSQETSWYGREATNDNYALIQLLKKLVQIKGLVWLRLLYLYPENVSDELIEFIAGEQKICKYFDLAVQHVNRGVLRRMGRKSSRSSLEKLINKIRRAMPAATLRFTLIVGFPGETKEAFAELQKFCRMVEVDYVGVFPYYREKGTRAYGMPNQCTREEKRDRVKAILETQKEVNRKLNQARIKKIYQSILISANYARTEFQMPEIDPLVYISQADTSLVGEFISVRITSASPVKLKGEIISDSSE